LLKVWFFDLIGGLECPFQNLAGQKAFEPSPDKGGPLAWFDVMAFDYFEGLALQFDFKAFSQITDTVHEILVDIVFFTLKGSLSDKESLNVGLTIVDFFPDFKNYL
jgi:hypothetical protein